RIDRGPARDRALHPRGRKHAAVSLHHRRSGHLDQAVDRRVFLAAHQGTYLRICLSRRQLCAPQYPEGCALAREGSCSSQGRREVIAAEDNAMTNRYFSLAGLTSLTVLLLSTVPVSGQTAKVAPKTSAIKRMPDGHPDLQGTYDLATVTPVDRVGPNLVLTKEEAAKLEAHYAQLRAQ